MLEQILPRLQEAIKKTRCTRNGEPGRTQLLQSRYQEVRRIRRLVEEARGMYLKDEGEYVKSNVPVSGGVIEPSNSEGRTPHFGCSPSLEKENCMHYGTRSRCMTSTEEDAF